MRNIGSLGIAVVEPRIWGCERAYAPAHPQIRTPSRKTPKTQNILIITAKFSYRNGPSSGGLAYDGINYFIKMFQMVYNVSGESQSKF